MDLGEDGDYFHSGEDEEGYAAYDDDEDDSYEGQYFPVDTGLAVGDLAPNGNHEDEISASLGMGRGSDTLAMAKGRKKRAAVVAKLGPKKRKKRSACHTWTSEARATEIVRQFAPDRTSAIFYLFRRIASGGMNKNLRIMPAKRNPPKYSCYFEELGMIADPDNDSHYHVWAWPAQGTPASKFMSTYVGATELEGVELGGATSDDEDTTAAGAPKEKPKRGRKRTKESNGDQEGGHAKAMKTEGEHRYRHSLKEEATEESTGEEQSNSSTSGARRRPDTTASVDDISEIELEIEYDDDEEDDDGVDGDYGHHHRHPQHSVRQQQHGDSNGAVKRRASLPERPAGKATSSVPALVVTEARNGHHEPHQPQPQLSAIHHHPMGDDHLAHLYSDLAAAEHLSLDEVLEHPALFGPDGVGASPALSNASFGNPDELMHTLLLQELDLDSVHVDFLKRLTGRSGEESAGNRAWSVYSGVWQGINEVAIKIYHEERAYHTECHHLWKFNHPNVVRAYGRLYAIPGRDIQGCVVLEKANLGDLHSWLIDNRKYLHDTPFVSHFLEIAKGVAAAMSYLHSASPALVHGDLKPSNVLLFGNRLEINGTPHYLGLRAKITDLGVSHELTNDSSGRTRSKSDAVRTLWQPPEQRSSYAAAHFATGTDVFPFGLLLWSFWSKTVSVQQLKHALPFSGTARPPIPKECPPQWASLIERCWAHDTRERIGFKEILQELCKIQP